MATYHIHTDNKKQYYWILKSDENGKTICMSSEAYVSMAGVKHSITWTRLNAPTKNEKDHT